jgi:hypothetical protein
MSIKKTSNFESSFNFVDPWVVLVLGRNFIGDSVWSTVHSGTMQWSLVTREGTISTGYGALGIGLVGKEQREGLFLGRKYGAVS